ncbi:MAG: helix-turn-helix transcriptional regulator [Bacteroidales bacterium]|nr:helix-turn-helix transcriptional regulator [Bacteroidales bacterium]
MDKKVLIYTLSILVAVLSAMTIMLLRKVRVKNREIRFLEESLVDEGFFMDDFCVGDAILTKREMEVVRLSCEGLVSKEIAEELGISSRTVDTHKINIFRKLGINNTVEMVRWAQKKGILH